MIPHHGLLSLYAEKLSCLNNSMKKYICPSTLLYELDRGEAEVIILAKEKEIREVLIDEKVARMQAKILGLEVVGTLGLLLRAKKKGILSEIKPLIEKMLQRGIWIRSKTVKGILKEAGED